MIEDLTLDLDLDILGLEYCEGCMIEYVDKGDKYCGPCVQALLEWLEERVGE